MPTAKLLRNGLVGAALLLVGGCGLLNFDMGDDAQASQGEAASARLPPPPPPAPRVARPSPRRLVTEKEAGGDHLQDSPPEIAQRAGELDPQPQPEVAAATPPAQEIAALPTPADLPPPVDPANDVRPQRVVGLTENALARWLGPPANTREESPARVWRYQGIECEFDVFFYLDLVSREFRALRYELKGSSNDDQRCLQPVFAGRGSPPRATARRVD